MSNPSSSSSSAAAAGSAAASAAQLLEENAHMRAMGTQLEQQLAAAREENRRLAAQQVMHHHHPSASVAAALAPATDPSGSSGARSGPAGTKLKPPTMTQFSGSNGMGFQVDTWLRNLKKQHDWHSPAVFPDDASKIKFAIMYMDGAALEWIDSLVDHEDIDTYEEFVRRLHDCYRPKLAAEVARQHLAQLHQTGGVSQLCSRMLNLLTHVPTMHEDDKIFTFKRALDKQIAAKVAEKAPATLHEAMGIAVLAEQYVGRSSFAKPNNYFFAKQGYGNFGRGGGSSSSGATPMELNHIGAGELDFHEDDKDQLPSAEDDQPAAPHHLLAMMQELKNQQHVLAAAFQKHRGAPPRRGPSHGAKPEDKSLFNVPGVSKEEYARCRKEGLCLKCKQTGHLARDCSKSMQRLKW